MNIFDLQYEFIIIEAANVAAYEKICRITTAQFLIRNATDAHIQCFLEETGSNPRKVLLTEMPPGDIYSNSSGLPIKYQIPQNTKISFQPIGGLPTTGKMYITLAQ
jgi:hypothetical protein